MGFFKGFAKVGSAIGSFFNPVMKAVEDFKNGEIGHGLGDIFVPGYASVRSVMDIDDENSNAYVPDDEVVIENIRSVDLNHDGVNLGHYADNAISYVYDNYVAPVFEHGEDSSVPDSESGSEESVGFIGVLVPVAVALATLLL